MTDDDKAWVVNLACQKPKDLGYAQELWTTRLLVEHVRRHCVEAGHSQLQNLAAWHGVQDSVSKSRQAAQIQYYLERRDPHFEAKMIQVLHVYKDVGPANRSADRPTR